VSATARKTVLELLSLAAGYLEKKGVPSARREADALLGHVLGCDRLHLYLRFEEAPLDGEVDAFRALMLRRGEREPLQYILGKVRFLDLELAVDRRALIPRPETEGLARRLTSAFQYEGLRAADIGTGSGCLALALARAGASVLATDISAEALELAAENAASNKLGDRVVFRRGDGLAALAGEAPYDWIVSNPPYIAAPAEATLQPEVARWEPAAALYSGREGLDLPLALLAGAPDALAPGGRLAMEFGAGQGPRLRDAAQSSGAWAELRIEKDVFDVDRFLLCQRA
jgi:release factor glutamine methyltransferase